MVYEGRLTGGRIHALGDRIGLLFSDRCGPSTRLTDQTAGSKVDRVLAAPSEVVLPDDGWLDSGGKCPFGIALTVFECV